MTFMLINSDTVLCELHTCALICLFLNVAKSLAWCVLQCSQSSHVLLLMELE